MCRVLYLGYEDLCNLSVLPRVDVMYHGIEHRLWAELDAMNHRRELTPPTALDELLSDTYVLSIPYGMDGAYDPARVVRDAGRARGAFTMGRTLEHSQASENFWWLHRYDQVDIFDSGGNVRADVLADLFRQTQKVQEVALEVRA